MKYNNKMIKIRDDLLKRYSNTPTLRSLVSAIPFVGGSIDVFVSAEWKNISEKRLTQLIERLNSEMSTLKVEQIDKEFIKTEEYWDLFRKVSEYSTKTRSIEKIELFSRIMKNSVVKGNMAKYPYIEQYIDSISELSEVEMVIVKEIYRMQQLEPLPGENELQLLTRAGWSRLADNIGMNSQNLDYHLKRIERTGFVKEITGGYMDYSGGTYVVTKAFINVMELIHEKD